MEVANTVTQMGMSMKEISKKTRKMGRTPDIYGVQGDMS